jgi:hypothetical protein
VPPRQPEVSNYVGEEKPSQIQMNPFAEYITEKLTELLETRRVVAWYDPKAEFADKVTSLGRPGSNRIGLPTVTEMSVMLWKRVE